MKTYEQAVHSPKKVAMTAETGFTTEELAFDYLRWDALVKERKSTLDPEVRHWLAVWDFHDLALNVRDDDDERRLERRGHYYGWFEAKKEVRQ